MLYVTLLIVSLKLKDGEGNEDASKKHVKFTKKNGRGNKVNISLCIMVYKIFFQISLTTSNYHFWFS